MSDSIRKQVHLKAPIARVWRALSDPGEFGAWFGLKLSGPFVAATTIQCEATDMPGWEGRLFDIEVVTVEPPTRLVVRWHPYPVDPEYDYSQDPMTTCEFTLVEVAGGTEFTVHESGFDAIPAARRAEAYRMNDSGWTIQSENIRRYVEA